ncbi:MAG TPA: MMPL family transporter, partial [Acidimicrobiales bacterium]|nr:MMPL family transporter [Acidimicrobiales bacterium]
MRRFWGWLGLNLGKRSGTVAMCGLLVTLAFGVGVTKLRFTTTNADYLNPHDPAWLANVAYDKVFGGDPMLTMITMNKGKTVDDLFTPKNNAEFKSIGDRLNSDPWVFSAVTPLDAMKLSQVLLAIPPGGSVLDSPGAQILEYANRQDHGPSQAKRGAYLLAEGNIISGFSPDQQVLTNPQWIHCLMHEPTQYKQSTCNGPIRTAVSAFVPNETHALLAIVLKGNLTINQEAQAANSVTAIVGHAQFQNAHILTTGVPELIKTINDYLKHGILVLAGVACVLMITILALSFTVRWRLLAFAIVAVGTIWGFGLVGFAGIPLTLATIAALPVLLGVGMDYAIQMHSRIEEEVVLDRAAHPVQAAARGLGPALLVVTFDAVFSFMALWFAKTPAIREFGSLLVVGIVAVCICSIILTLS